MMSQVSWSECEQGRPIFLEDVAEVSTRPDAPDSYVWLGTGPGARAAGLPPVAHAPAVTIAVSKKPGTNAISRRAAGN